MPPNSELYGTNVGYKNPDFLSISNQLNISQQLSNIEGSIIYPSISISNTANYSERNLTSFGFSDEILGSGDSDGIMKDEYLPQETKDGIEIIAWITSTIMSA